MATPLETVRTFIEEMINGNNPQGILSMVSEDVFYQNMPLKPARGIAEMAEFITDLGEIQDMTLKIHHIAENADGTVFTERSDSWTMNGVKVVCPFVGVFQVRMGKIVSWKDYFDLDMWASSGQHSEEFWAKWGPEARKADEAAHAGASA
ncbi:MAG TPA: limonene-1,2-epoxide hydrolase family protein [Pseudonocardia sp.]|jgi:limonene-1,2-epoxide hydrolase|nr:limonene-1,2-epoxide hydrolase family protein [Pseudonocardia sp.]